MNTKPPNPIGPNDYDRLRALWDAAGLPYKPNGRDSQAAFRQQLDGGQQTVIGIEDGQKRLVAAVMVTHDGRKGWINRLAVHPDARRQGLGSQLIAAAEDALQAQGIGVYAALIESENEASLATFEANGYQDWPSLHYVSKRVSKDI